MMRRAGAAVLGPILAGALLVGCGGGDDEPAADTSSAAAAETGYLPVPDGVELTEPGTELALGDPATVAWEPRQDSSAVVELTVKRIERTTFAESFDGWEIDDKTAALTPYFVRAEATNVSGEDLSGTAVLLWARDDAGTLIDTQRFQKKKFTPCPSPDLPDGFADGESADVCFVYLLAAGRSLDAVVFPPPAGLDPIAWQGKISTEVKIPKPEKSDKKDTSGKKDKSGKKVSGTDGAGKKQDEQ